MSFVTLATIAGLFVTLSACDRTTVHDPSLREASSDVGGGRSLESSVDGSEIAENGSLSLPDRVRTGICLAHSWQDDGVDGYGTETSRGTLTHLDSLGVDSISLTPFGWMSGLKAVEIRGEHTGEMPDGGETASALTRMIDQAHALDMRVVLKPHLWIRDGAWRGEIEPTEGGEPAWKAWWRHYREFIAYYAKLAARHDVETLVVGVELNSAIEARPEAFRETIEQVRGLYDGRLTYGANWHGATISDDLWRRLDAVGVQFYPPLTDASAPDVATLRRAIRSRLESWRAAAERVDRPLEILEVGYKSAPTAVSEPWEWPERLDDGPRRVDEQLQADAYRALFAELARLDRLRGVYVWKYFTDPARDEGGKVGFSPRGKRAETVLRRAYR